MEKIKLIKEKKFTKDELLLIYSSLLYYINNENCKEKERQVIINIMKKLDLIEN